VRWHETLNPHTAQNRGYGYCGSVLDCLLPENEMDAVRNEGELFRSSVEFSLEAEHKPVLGSASSSTFLSEQATGVGKFSKLTANSVWQM
jgi:hypothetical protein